jgi:fluoroquinolone transport system permease protein
VTSALTTLILNDLRLQWRYGIHAAYGVVVLFYVLAFAFGGAAMPDWLAGGLIYSDPSVLGFFFLGGLMMLEKSEGVRAALAVSPATALDYLAAKTTTLTALALAAVIAMGLARSGPVNWPLLIISVALTSIFFVAIGTAIALRFKTVNSYLIGSAGLLTPFILPAIAAFIDPMPAALGLVPTIAQARLTLMALGFGSGNGIEITLMLAVMTASAIVALVWSRRALQVELGRK